MAAFGLAVAMVAVAASLRWLIVDSVGQQIPFITFFPAIFVVSLLGGFWPGALAIVLSALAAWYLFIPPYFTLSIDERGQTQLFLFIVVAFIELGILAVLNALVERLILQQRNIRILLEAAPNGLVLVDGSGTIKLVNESTEKLFGYSREELAGKDVEVLVPKQQASAHRKDRESYQEKPEVRQMGQGRDLRGRRKDGTEFPVEIGLNPVGRDGQPAILATVMDISARKQAEENQHLIIGELRHRTANLLTVVQAIISNTVKESTTLVEAGHVLSGRMEALSNAYSLLADAAWKGASLVKILSAHSILDAKHVTIDGCEINLTPRAAQQFAMIVHELATNALKYGALSCPDGRVSISGELDGYDGSRSFLFSWKESGGPRILLSTPTRKGFGSVILLDSARQLGTVTMDYLPEGLLYQLKFDVTEIEAPSNVVTLPTAPKRSVQ
jgi:PAS domain S-box-containing protein